MFETRTSTVPITKEMVKAAYRKVKANHGAAGVDKESLAVYQEDLLNNLYVLWNRLSSGSYFPKPLRSVSIPKSNGKQRCISGDGWKHPFSSQMVQLSGRMAQARPKAE